MKRNLLLIGCILGAALFSNRAAAQITFSEDFESNVNWTGSEFINTTNLPCEGTHSYMSDLHGGFVSNGSDATVSPSLGTSNGNQVSLTYNYKVLDDTGEVTQNSSAWGSLTVSWGASANGPWTELETMGPANHVESAECAERTVTFTPAAGSQVYIRFNTILNNINNFIHIYIDDITATQQGTNCDTPAPVADAVQTVCEGSVLSQLEAEGDEIIWYTAATGGLALSESTVLANGGIYYASQIPTGGCESTTRTQVTVEVNTPPVPTGDSTQEITTTDEMPQGRPFSMLEVETEEGAIIKWYVTEEDANTGANPNTENDMFMGDGTYYVTQTIDGCESGPFAVTVDVVLSDKDFDAASFKHYPNPVMNVLTISYAEAITSVEVYNVVGQQVLAKQINANEAQLDMSKLSAGTYIVKISAADAVKIIKIVKH